MASYRNTSADTGRLTAAEFLKLEYKLLDEGKILSCADSPSGSVQGDALARMQQIKTEIRAMNASTA